MPTREEVRIEITALQDNCKACQSQVTKTQEREAHFQGKVNNASAELLSQTAELENIENQLTTKWSEYDSM